MFCGRKTKLAWVLSPGCAAQATRWPYQLDYEIIPVKTEHLKKAILWLKNPGKVRYMIGRIQVYCSSSVANLFFGMPREYLDSRTIFQPSNRAIYSEHPVACNRTHILFPSSIRHSCSMVPYRHDFLTCCLGKESDSSPHPAGHQVQAKSFFDR